ncbi:MAG: hypothetical protein EBU90_07760 [Proteobacteria bacterium]|nr:hypothetical protein [Pseudomonadota bacterium]NBP14094.1 hypothetical protein [bacterium]
MNTDKKLQEFCWKYDATIQPSHKKWRRARKTKPSNIYEDGPVYSSSMDYDEIPLAEIHLPSDRLMALVDLEDFKDRLHYSIMNPILNSGLVNHMLKEYEEECRIRHTNPAVQKAYQQYKMLLNLSR